MTAQTLCARAGAAALLLLASASVAAAQQPASKQQPAKNEMMMSASMKQACASDIKTLCKGVEAGGGRQMQCLKDNSAKVSPKCKEAMKTAKASEGAKTAPK